MQRRGLFPAALLFALVLASGCASYGGGFQEPTVELTGAEVTRMSLSGQTVVLGFRVFNPNPLPLPVKRIRYRVRLNEQEFAGGETDGRFSVPAGGEGEFAISVNLDLMRSGPQLAMLLQNGVAEDLRYELRGDLHLDVPASPTLRFREEGAIPLRVAGQ